MQKVQLIEHQSLSGEVQEHMFQCIFLVQQTQKRARLLVSACSPIAYMYISMDKESVDIVCFPFVSPRLLRNASAVDDLLRFGNGDLSLLFGAISSPCPRYNKIWRKTAADCLVTICRCVCGCGCGGVCGGVCVWGGWVWVWVCCVGVFVCECVCV